MKAEAWQCRDGLWVEPFHRSPGLWESMLFLAWAILSIMLNRTSNVERRPLSSRVYSEAAFTAAPPSGHGNLCLPKPDLFTPALHAQVQCFADINLPCCYSLCFREGSDKTDPLLLGDPSWLLHNHRPTSYLMFSLKELPQEMLVNRTCGTGSSQHTQPAVLAAAAPT